MYRGPILSQTLVYNCFRDLNGREENVKLISGPFILDSINPSAPQELSWIAFKYVFDILSLLSYGWYIWMFLENLKYCVDDRFLLWLISIYQQIAVVLGWRNSKTPRYHFALVFFFVVFYRKAIRTPRQFGGKWFRFMFFNCIRSSK